MNHPASIADIRRPGEALREEAIGLTVGVAFTFALFFGMAHFENLGTASPPAEIEDLRMVALPAEPLPPLPTVVQPAEAPEAALPFSGIETGATDSPVSIAVVPPDLEALLPVTANLPPAKVQFNVLHTEFKPKVNLETDVRHVFQESEVDQKPHAVVRTTPAIPPDVSGNLSTLRVVLLLQLDQQGTVENARVLHTSGNSKFDEIVARTVREEWVFSPATRHGKKVKVLAQQSLRINFDGGGSPFTLDR